MISRHNIPKELAHLIPSFLNHREGELTELKKSLQEKNYSAISFIAHRLKGIGASYGFNEISEVGESLETACALKNDHELIALINHLDSVVQILKKEVNC
jgi:HPt (histidine-containing phosphotransfer) domain-containing protein